MNFTTDEFKLILDGLDALVENIEDNRLPDNLHNSVFDQFTQALIPTEKIGEFKAFAERELKKRNIEKVEILENTSILKAKIIQLKRQAESDKVVDDANDLLK